MDTGSAGKLPLNLALRKRTKPGNGLAVRQLLSPTDPGPSPTWDMDSKSVLEMKQTLGWVDPGPPPTWDFEPKALTMQIPPRNYGNLTKSCGLEEQLARKHPQDHWTESLFRGGDGDDSSDPFEESQRDTSLY